MYRVPILRSCFYNHIVDKDTVEKKRDLTVDQFRPYFKKGTILPLQFVVIKCICRQAIEWAYSKAREFVLGRLCI